MAVQNPLGPRPGGNSSLLNVTSPTVVKGQPGTLYVVVQNAAAASVSACYDAVTTANTVLGVTAANLIGNIPANTVGPQEFTWPCQVGITIVPGTSAVCSVSFS